MKNRVLFVHFACEHSHGSLRGDPVGHFTKKTSTFVGISWTFSFTLPRQFREHFHERVHWETDFYTSPVLRGAALFDNSAQQCIKSLFPKDPEFYTPLALNCQKGQQLSALEVYKNQSPILGSHFAVRKLLGPLVHANFPENKANGPLVHTNSP